MKDIETRMANRKEKKSKRKKCYYWFKKYHTRHLICYPLLIIHWSYNCIIKKIFSFCKWDDKRADKIITEDIVHNGKLKEGIIHYYCRDCGWDVDRKPYYRLRDKVFCCNPRFDISGYLFNNYQLEGYSKKWTYDGEWYDYTFTKNN